MYTVCDKILGNLCLSNKLINYITYAYIHAYISDCTDVCMLNGCNRSLFLYQCMG